MKQFDLLPNQSNLILYGAGTNGIVTKNILSHIGINVCGFIDLRADEIKEIDSIPVWDIDDPECLRYSKKGVILITVKNVFEHQKIVRTLIRRGFENIIYKPYSVLTGNGTEQEINISNAFDGIIKGRETILRNVPCTCGVLLNAFHDKGMIIDGEEITFWSPVSLVYTNRVENSKAPWADINCSALFPHIELFRFFGGDHNSSFENYLKLCVQLAKQINNDYLTDKWKKNVLINRYEVFQNMEYFYNIDNNFFIRNAPYATWNEKGYFNLTGGKHRVTYLISKGYSFVPLKTSRESYQKFVNLQSANMLNDYLIKHDMNDFSIPIMHPYFYDVVGKNNCFYLNFSSKITEYLAVKLYRKNSTPSFCALSILDAINAYGICSRHFQKMGSTVFRLENTQSEITDILDHLFYSVKIPYYNSAKSIQKFDIVFVENVNLVINNKISCRYLLLLCKQEEAEKYKCLIKNKYRYIEPVFTGVMNNEIYIFQLYQNEQMEN